MEARHFEKLEKKATYAKVLLVINIGLIIPQMALWAWWASDFELIDDGVADSLATIETIGILMLLVTGIVFVIWSYAAHKSLRMFKRHYVFHSHQAAIWWWIVPIVNLWMPFRVMFETVRGSVAQVGDPHWKNSRVPGTVVAWTAVWLISVVGDRVLAVRWQNADIFSDLTALMVTTAIFLGIRAAAAFLAIKMIAFVTGQQRERVDEVVASAAPVA